MTYDLTMQLAFALAAGISIGGIIGFNLGLRDGLLEGRLMERDRLLSLIDRAIATSPARGKLYGTLLGIRKTLSK